MTTEVKRNSVFLQDMDAKVKSRFYVCAQVWNLLCGSPLLCALTSCIRHTGGQKEAPSPDTLIWPDKKLAKFASVLPHFGRDGGGGGEAGWWSHSFRKSTEYGDAELLRTSRVNSIDRQENSFRRFTSSRFDGFRPKWCVRPAGEVLVANKPPRYGCAHSTGEL